MLPPVTEGLSNAYINIVKHPSGKMSTSVQDYYKHRFSAVIDLLVNKYESQLSIIETSNGLKIQFQK